MDVAAIETTSILAAITEKASLIAFELLIIIAMGLVIKTLYYRNVQQGDAQAKAMTDSTIAINNNNIALNALTKQIERLNDAR